MSQVADFLDEYYTNYVEADGLKSAGTVCGHIKQLKEALGELPVTALEKPADIARFKAQYRKGRTLATVNRVLGVLRAAVNWGRFQDPPLLSTSPFHRFGISIKRRDENKRDRRARRDEEQQFLAACLTMNTAEHKWVGPAMHDRIIGALETCCQQGEMLRVRNRDAIDAGQLSQRLADNLELSLHGSSKHRIALVARELFADRELCDQPCRTSDVVEVLLRLKPHRRAFVRSTDSRK
ncbi:MAG: hypothetical protein ACRD2X_08025 [Vicinamibacteraceae bacterium]